MRQADLVKVINETHQLCISQKVVKERIDKIYKYIKNQVILNKEKFERNELILFKKYIESIERKNFNQYTGAIFCSLLLLYENEKKFRSVLKGRIVNSLYIEDFITGFENYINQFLFEIHKIYDEKLLDEFERNEIYSIHILKDFLIKIFDIEKVLEEKLNNELKDTESLMSKINGLSTYRKFLFIEKFNKKLEKLIQKEEWNLKEELRSAIEKHDLDTITEIITELRFYFNNKDKNNVVNKEKVFRDLEGILLQSQNYSKLKAMEQINYFIDIITTYRDEKAIKIIGNLNELMHKGGDEVTLFLEKTIALYEQEQEVEYNTLRENRDKTKKALFRVGRLRSNTEMKEILEQREEYLYIKVNDKQLFKSLEKLIDISIKNENQAMLLNIDFILKYYKKFLM
ncbi:MULTISPECIES: hypothetical protein [Bacillus]|uniref:hypothetical protein n=1 Tax=Bacillus TaxID=1386 RepID=UPI00077A7751|nr:MULTISPECIES: hypothetical protein [Bacillus cereus group]KXY70690.1 hypothetical protein AT270_27220 [Bacillus cereus]MBG9937526.1 hypothetical protein [Bacillus tropicus]MED2993813.1 hypothetical protein [Bacillus tropicus]OTY56525.1 hypothetical protein BK748_15430 [Bacillus thuringiensis serovar graciosensis]